MNRLFAFPSHPKVRLACCLIILMACSRKYEAEGSGAGGNPAAEQQTTATTSPTPPLSSEPNTLSPVKATNVATALQVIEPADGSEITISELVRGTTPYTGRHHYVVVTPRETPDVRWIQDAPVIVQPDGNWRGGAQFGQGGNGKGKYFLVRCLATASELQSGSIEPDKIPADAVFSPAVQVKRTR